MKIMQEAKKRAIALVVCGAMALTLNVSAADAEMLDGVDQPDRIMITAPKMEFNENLIWKVENGAMTFSNDNGATWSETPPMGGLGIGRGHGPGMRLDGDVEGQEHMRIMVREEDGVRQFSVDGGETWSETAPEGMKVHEGKEGEFFGGHGALRSDGQFMVKEEDGVRLFSSDGGETWNEAPAERVKTREQMNSEFCVNVPGVGELMIKMEDGVKLYSVDSGETWSETAPEGINVHEGKEGEFFGGHGAFHGDSRFMVKEEDGVRLFSTDGGATWSETAPEGLPELPDRDKMAVKAPEFPADLKFMMKIQDGTRLFSTDDGATWSETAPEGLDPMFNRGFHKGLQGEAGKHLEE